MVHLFYVDIAIGTVCTIVTMVTIVTNALVIYFAKRARNAPPSTVFVMSLAMADIFVAILVMPFSAYATINDRMWYMAPWTCKLYLSSDAFFWTASVLHFLVLAIDRYEAVHKPLEYSQNPRKVKSAITLVLVWSTAAVTSYLLYMVVKWPEASGQPCLLKTNYVGLWSLICFYIPLGISIVLYICVYRKIRTTIGKSAVSGLAEARAREHRVAKVLLTVITGFLICVTPISVFNISLPLICKNISQCHLSPLFLSLLISAKHSNSTFNGIILLTCNRDYRSKLLKAVGLNRDTESNNQSRNESRSQSKSYGC
ncbi:5-hydroxytryptamine receptor 1D [Halotydeus destructor]|nr:5-hydroxytryptamine receptor 1D [Halotydeus destructor]